MSNEHLERIDAAISDVIEELDHYQPDRDISARTLHTIDRLLGETRTNAEALAARVSELEARLGITSTIGFRIREARKAAGLSQTQLGQRLRRSRTHAAISELERGKVRPKAEELQEIAQILGTPVSSFYGDVQEGDCDEMTNGHPVVKERSKDDAMERQDRLTVVMQDAGIEVLLIGEIDRLQEDPRALAGFIQDLRWHIERRTR